MILIQFIRIRNCTPSFKHQGFPVFISINYSFYVFFMSIGNWPRHFGVTLRISVESTTFSKPSRVLKALQGVPVLV